ncbi:PIN domain-containing protein [Dokdonella sp.]|uniref:PIN domain-containing protein n=1 Tax=Dokdonella sp. TaxID=2291710 RepID=UPI0025C111FE|nr:PIN domain-containing protein [Dokdonella sp.]MBX3692880.1 PIN domain-containing protein [Dokdonella sp.]MCW5566643.1 PIN domain-containing protein [Dokdonella sp.]
MNRWLLDTNVLSELRRPRPQKKVVNFIQGCSLDQLYVSTISFAEIRFGIEQVADAARRADLRHWLDQRLRPLFAQRTLEVS